MNDAGPVPPRGSGPRFFRPPGIHDFAGVVLLIAIGGNLGDHALQKFITFPRAHPSVQQPGARTAAGGEAIWFDVDGARVEAWFLPARTTARAPLLVHAHGNGELIDIQVQSVAPLRDAGIGVLLVEYPGYGRSTGSPSEESVTATFLAAYDWASHESRVDPRSASSATDARSVAEPLLNSPRAVRWRRWCSNRRSPASATLVRAKGIPAWLVVNEFDTRAVLAKYPGPVLILHGTQDGTFPVALAHALHKASPRSDVASAGLRPQRLSAAVGAGAQFPRQERRI